MNEKEKMSEAVDTMLNATAEALKNFGQNTNPQIEEVKSSVEKVENLIKESTNSNQNRKVRVIADFPDMIVHVGDVIDWPYGRIYVTDESAVDPSDYPHLFEVFHEVPQPPKQ